MSTAGGLKRVCLHLGDLDRESLEIIKTDLKLNSTALAARVAIRSMAKRIKANKTASGADQPAANPDLPDPKAG